MFWSIDGLFQRQKLPDSQKWKVIKSYIKKLKEENAKKKGA